MPLAAVRRLLSIRILVVVGALAALALAYRFTIYGKLLRPYHDGFQRGSLAEWKPYGGSWAANDGVLDLSGARGDKSIVGSPLWSDYVVETDLRLNADPADSMYGDAGVIFRVTDASIGVDSYDGYYVGIGSEGSVLLLGRANYSWARLSAVPLSVPAKRGNWFHLALLAKGCYFEATATDLTTAKQARLTYFEQDCTKRSGAVGVRTFGLPASWKNFSVHRPED